jgi:hypothetical protein
MAMVLFEAYYQRGAVIGGRFFWSFVNLKFRAHDPSIPLVGTNSPWRKTIRTSPASERPGTAALPNPHHGYRVASARLHLCPNLFLTSNGTSVARGLKADPIATNSQLVPQRHMGSPP